MGFGLSECSNGGRQVVRKDVANGSECIGGGVVVGSMGVVNAYIRFMDLVEKFGSRENLVSLRDFGFAGSVSCSVHGLDCYGLLSGCVVGDTVDGDVTRCKSDVVVRAVDSGSCGCKNDITSGGDGSSGSEVKPRLKGQLKRGPNYERNQAARERRAKMKKEVPEWRRKGGCVKERSVETQQALEKMWISKNKVATLKYEAEAKRLEASAANSRPFKFVERKPKTQEELDLEAAERIKKLKQRIEKHDADIAYWKKRQDSGAIDKAIALENEILDGQLSGKYDPFASRRMLGWAKTVKTHASGTGSGSGSSGSLDKTVWSGSGATTKTDLSVLEQKVAVYEEKLKKSEKDVVELGKKADELNKQLITVTVESERKDKELFEVKKFKEYLEKAKKEKKRRADNEFETFRTQADCSY